MKLNFTLIALGLVASTAALASTPTYKCGTSASADDTKNSVMLTLNNDGSIDVNNSGENRTMERAPSDDNAPAGYTAYTGLSGCPQNVNGGMRCGAVSVSTLFVAYPMVSGTASGKAVLNGQDLYCSIQQ